MNDASRAPNGQRPCPWFVRLSNGVAREAGRPRTSLFAAGAVVVWAACGPFFDFSDTWQLVVNTSTTIITFLMVFIIQNTQTRDTQAMQVKLDELIRATQGAHNALLDLEELDQDELDKIRLDYEKLAQAAREQLGRLGGRSGSALNAG